VVQIPLRQNGRPHSNVREDHSSKSVEPKARYAGTAIPNQASRKNLADAGIPPEFAAETLEDAKDSIMARMPKSKSRAMHAAALFESAVVSSLANGRNALKELRSTGKIERLGEGTCGSPFHYFTSGAEKPGRTLAGRNT
jgi:hypothetical protein